MRHRFNWSFIITWSIIVLFLFAFWSFVARAAFGDTLDMEAIKQIESSGNPDAVSYLGAKYGRGLYQISEVCLQDYNEMTGSDVQPEELFAPETNREVALWYTNERIPALLRHFGIEVTTEAAIWAYSAGIGRVVEGVLPPETKEYLKKYRRLTKTKGGGK